MDFIRILSDKKTGKALTDEQIAYFARTAADGSVPDYQLAALLMAIRLNGMDARETSSLTLEMARSGHMLDPDVGGVPVDKHSTGGVGDTTTLVLVPLAAACGAKVLKMSGRGLGHTGGTVDKLDSIPGMRTTLDEGEFVEIVRRVGCAVIGQSKELAPADKRLYALRDVTSTVDSIPLIASSILSKKMASGARGIVLDVKTGSGAILESLEESIELARAMVDIGTRAGRHVSAVITGMQEPLGSHVGNALEVKEAIDVLSGRTGGPLLEVSLLLGTHMLLAAGVAVDPSAAREMLEHALRSGAGLCKLKQMIAAQGGDPDVCDNVSLLPRARLIMPVKAEADGYVAGMDTRALGFAAQALGAGRLLKEDAIDPAVGFVMEKRIGDRVRAGDTLATVHANDAERLSRARAEILRAVHIGHAPVPPARLVYAEVTPGGVVELQGA
jgi:pyrimidine-nucleoside phosphorylase